MPNYPATEYPVPKRDDDRIRAFQEEVLEHMKAKGPMVDVRSPRRIQRVKLHMPEYPQEGAMRGGHIPGAKSVPWARAANADTGSSRPREELAAIYEGEIGLKKDDDIIAYCRIGERSSHTWFVLKLSARLRQVRNYDGSWTEWGNMVRAPIEK